MRTPTFKTTTTSFIKMCGFVEPKEIKLFPDDVVIAIFNIDGKEVSRSFYPARLALYKYLWDESNDAGKATLRKHLKRCIDVREQFKKKLCSEEIQVWYMAIVLGSADV